MRSAIACLLWVGFHVAAWSQDFACRPLPGGERECVFQDFHPGGSTVITEWRKKKEAIPYKKQVEGARSGSLLVGQLRLRLAENRSWLIERANGDTQHLLDVGDTGRVVRPPIQEGGFRWQLTVTRQDPPASRPGVSDEAEPRLDVQILRLKATPTSARRPHPKH